MLRIIALLLATTCFATNASSAVLRFDFSGTTNTAYLSLPAGSPFSGFFIYDTDQTSNLIVDSASVSHKEYQYQAAQFTMAGTTITAGTRLDLFVATVSDGLLNPVAVQPGDFFQVLLTGVLPLVPGASPSAPENFFQIRLIFGVPEHTFTNLALPTDTSFFSGPNQNTLHLTNPFNDPFGTYIGSVTAISAAEVPLPATVPLMIGGLLALGSAFCQRRSL